jgi:hypothetical protein
MRWKSLLMVWLLLILLGSGVYATEQKGVTISSSETTWVQNDPINVTDDSGGPTYGIYVEYATDPLALTVNATVNSTATNSDGESYAYGVYSYNETDPSNSRPLSNLVVTGNGNINATAEGSSAEAYGVYVDTIGGDFTNSGTISATAAGATDAFAFGVGIDTINGNFTNTGTISATAQANGNDDEAKAYAYGVYVDDDIEGNFTNTGTISAKATVGDAVGEGSYVYAWGSGVYIDGAVDSFINKGDIKVNVQAGSAIGDNSIVEADSISGVEIW